MSGKVQLAWAVVIVDPNGDETLLVQAFPSSNAIGPTLSIEPKTRDRFLRQAQDISDATGQTVRVIELAYSRELQCFRPSSDRRPS
jgi:hypothetical protein